MTRITTQPPQTRGGLPRRLVVGFIVVAAVLLASAAALFGGASQAKAAGSGEGWVRVGHLSPDTKAVDVTLTSLAGGQVVYKLDDVTYGQVSPYKELPDGTYTVAMRAAGAAASAKPVISDSITVATGKPITVVAYGKNAALKTTVFQDDLTAPAAGDARIRLVQAATVSKSVSVKTSTGTPVATNAPFGSASGYASVGAGKWTLDLTGKQKATASTANVSLASGSITTLFVLDNSKNGITIVPVVDSAATTTTPKGGVQTGGGYEATHPQLDLTSGFVPFSAVG
ncbi:DUF4397 domain-containing protein [Frondihabitans australicus]|uniref:Uncharacterized protein DUF4397 n=1 Tax=Frondihabitans australicus TaxID=386892 RepID=A0A495IDI9_9MICO|nr:DUF4397 domain-containing protein [Frondihabitans australicus]RKR73381.1 uncharacterized protein DUF4397 [Frondihabitans australicus]